jgi:hypothetical protein
VSDTHGRAADSAETVDTDFHLEDLLIYGGLFSVTKRLESPRAGSASILVVPLPFR